MFSDKICDTLPSSWNNKAAEGECRVTAPARSVSCSLSCIFHMLADSFLDRSFHVINLSFSVCWTVTRGRTCSGDVKFPSGFNISPNSFQGIYVASSHVISYHPWMNTWVKHNKKHRLEKKVRWSFKKNHVLSHSLVAPVLKLQ